MTSILPKKIYDRLMASFRSGKSREEELKSIGEAVVERALELSTMLGTLMEANEILSYGEARWRMRDLIPSMLNESRIIEILDLRRHVGDSGMARSVAAQEQAAQDLAKIFDNIEKEAQKEKQKQAAIKEYAEYGKTFKVELASGGPISSSELAFMPSQLPAELIVMQQKMNDLRAEQLAANPPYIFHFDPPPPDQVTGNTVTVTTTTGNELIEELYHNQDLANQLLARRKLYEAMKPKEPVLELAFKDTQRTIELE